MTTEPQNKCPYCSTPFEDPGNNENQIINCENCKKPFAVMIKRIVTIHAFTSYVIPIEAPATTTAKIPNVSDGFEMHNKGTYVITWYFNSKLPVTWAFLKHAASKQDLNEFIKKVAPFLAKAHKNALLRAITECQKGRQEIPLAAATPSPVMLSLGRSVAIPGYEEVTVQLTLTGIDIKYGTKNYKLTSNEIVELCKTRTNKEFKEKCIAILGPTAGKSPQGIYKTCYALVTGIIKVPTKPLEEQKCNGIQAI